MRNHVLFCDSKLIGVSVCGERSEALKSLKVGGTATLLRVYGDVIVIERKACNYFEESKSIILDRESRLP